MSIIKNQQVGCSSHPGRAFFPPCCSKKINELKACAVEIKMMSV
jgi:hypothetical protein